MTHEVANTSRDALQRLKESGQDVTDRKRCKLIIKEYGPITMEDMEIHMGKTKSAFSGRINELKEDDTVKVVGREDGHQLLDLVSQHDAKKTDSVQDSDTGSDGLKPECTDCGRQYEVLGVAVACCEDVEQERGQETRKPEAGEVLWG